jgi:hypothetical protein
MLVVMVGEAYVATVATRHPSAGFTFEHGGISPSVLEEDNLLALHEGIALIIQCFSSKKAKVQP